MKNYEIRFARVSIVIYRSLIELFMPTLDKTKIKSEGKTQKYPVEPLLKVER